MVVGEARDFKYVVDQKPLAAHLDAFVENPNHYLKQQATYAFRDLPHVPSDEAYR
jgi:hypothetical protein